MVLYKRKPIHFKQTPESLGDNAEVWVMRGSDEIFTSYEDYLERFDFYSQHNFTDAVNGKTGMTFFEAVESESASTSDIERIFPDALRAPILRTVQFSEIARMDDLVNHIYEEFRSDFFPGEEITGVLDDGEQIECTIREKANFPELRNPDGSIQRAAFARYFVQVKSSDDEAIVHGDNVKRARNVFTKMNVRCYLKHCLWRESWIGAPWLVREPLAQYYRLPMNIPYHLTQEAKIAQTKASLAQKDQKDTAPIKGKRKSNNKAFSVDQLLQQEVDAQIKEEAARPDPPKYPIEDLDIEPSRDGSSRPRLKYIAPLDGTPSPETGLSMNSVGAALEIWNALNVHWDLFQLEPFTFDDFIDAMRFSAPNITCELFDEMHCGVLKTLVDEEGEVLITLPDLDDEEEEEEEDEEEDDSPPPPVEPSPKSRKSRLSQVQNMEPEAVSSDKPVKTHQAVEMLDERGWAERLHQSELTDGGWQIIMIGLLYQISLDKVWISRCEPILTHLAPLDQPANERIARHQYSTLDVNLRIAALQIVLVHAMGSQTMRKHLEDRSDEMTLVRKQKTEMQRTRKEFLKELQRLELDRAEANPDALVDDEDAKDTPVMTNGHGHDDTLSTINGTNSSDEDDEDAARPLRRSNNARKRKRDEENAKKESERLARLSAQKESADKLKKYRKILRDIEKTKEKVVECERTVETCDERLREMNCNRMKSLGRDRFWNRYWWFERVGLPINGMREPVKKKARIETEEPAGYANGRLWVQGPGPMEREGFINMNPADAQQYSKHHGMTVLERKKAEEGSTGVSTSEQWGFYEVEDDLDALIGWLDERGRREKDLSKELTAWREDIVSQMKVLHRHLHPEEAATNGDAASDNEAATAPRTRVSTRNKTYVDTSDIEKHWRCLRWRNVRASTASGKHCPSTVVPMASAPVTQRQRKGLAVPTGRKVSSTSVASQRNGSAASKEVRVVSTGGRSAAREAAAAISEAAVRERRAEREAVGVVRRGLRSTR